MPVALCINDEGLMLHGGWWNTEVQYRFTIYLSYRPHHRWATPFCREIPAGFFGVEKGK